MMLFMGYLQSDRPMVGRLLREGRPEAAVAGGTARPRPTVGRDEWECESLWRVGDQLTR